MKVLVIGNGGREHALAWKLVQSPKVQTVYVAPGNGGTALDKRLHNLAITDHAALADFAVAEKIALTVVGPEARWPAAWSTPSARGLRIFGPTKGAAQLESSKAFAKAFMKRHGIPTAAYEASPTPPRRTLRGRPWRADRHQGRRPGRRQGRGGGHDARPRRTRRSTGCSGPTPGRQTGAHNQGGARGDRGIPRGEEASFIVVSDGSHVVPLATSQDHKRLQDDDQGPNTGGMGLFAGAGGHAQRACAGDARDHPAPRWRAWPPTACPFTGFLTPA